MLHTCLPRYLAAPAAHDQGNAGKICPVTGALFRMPLKPSSSHSHQSVEPFAGPPATSGNFCCAPRITIFSASGRRCSDRPAHRLRHRSHVTHQWAAIMEGDESYAGSRSLSAQEFGQDIVGYAHVIPLIRDGLRTHPIQCNVQAGRLGADNTHFDTTAPILRPSGPRR